jgi:hypothetical protein
MGKDAQESTKDRRELRPVDRTGWRVKVKSKW